MDSLEKRVRILFSQCRRNELPQSQADQEFTVLRRDYYKVLEDADEKVQLASQMYDLVERYLRRLDSELHKFKCELEADHNGITEILEKRSLELDGNSSSSNSHSLMLGGSGTGHNNSQKENRYFGSIGGGGSHSIGNSHSSVRERDRYRQKAEKRRDSNNGPSSLLASSGGPPEKRQMISGALVSGLNHGTNSNSASSGGHQGSQANHANTVGGQQVVAMRTGSNQHVNVNFHYGSGQHSHHGTASAGAGGQNLNLPANVVNPVIVTTTLGTGANAVNLGTTSYTAESEVMRAATQAIAMTHQMQQGRRTASLKASVEAATSGGVSGGGPGKDLLGRELVGATHNAIQAVERESFNSNQRRQKK